MDLKKIQELIKLVKKNEIGELKVKEGDFAISIKNLGFETVVTSPVAMPQLTEATVQAHKAETAPPQAEAPKADPKNDNVITFRSPMVGTFYRKPGADKD